MSFGLLEVLPHESKVIHVLLQSNHEGGFVSRGVHPVARRTAYAGHRAPDHDGTTDGVNRIKSEVETSIGPRVVLFGDSNNLACSEEIGLAESTVVAASILDDTPVSIQVLELRPSSS